MTQDSGLGVHVELAASVSGLRNELETQRSDRYKLNRLILPLAIPLQSITLSGGGGTLDMPEMLGPRSSWQWELDGMGAQGFSAGSVAVYLNNINAEEIFNFSSAGVFYQRKFRFLNQAQRLIFVATGITGTASIWINGIQFHDSVAGQVIG